MIGTWQYVHENGDYITFDLEDISILDDTVYFSHETSSWNWLNIYAADNVPYKTEHTSKPFLMSRDKLDLLGKELEIPVGMYGRICLGSTLNEDGSISDVDCSGSIEFNKDTGCTLRWSTGGGVFAEGHTANLSKIS